MTNGVTPGAGWGDELRARRMPIESTHGFPWARWRFAEGCSRWWCSRTNVPSLMCPPIAHWPNGARGLSRPCAFAMLMADCARLF